MLRKYLLLIFFIIIQILTSCTGQSEYNFIPQNHVNTLFANISELSLFINEYIDYKSDGNTDHWQYPHDTYFLRTGDCEDFAILKMYWTYYCFGVRGQLYGIDTGWGYHAVFYYNGYFYDWKTYPYNEYVKTIFIIRIFSYSEVLEKCY